MQAARGVARCVTIACQRLQEQRNKPLSEDSLVAAYTLGRHFANSMRVPMQDSSELWMRCRPFSPEVPDSHPGRLHAAVRVVDIAWRDDGGLEMLQQLVEELEEAGVRPAYTQRLSPEGNPPGDPNDSASSAIAQGHGAAVLIAGHPRSNEYVNPTSTSLAQGHGPLAGAHSVDSHGALDHGGVLSPPAPPKGGVTDFLACIATRGHGTPGHMPQVCPTGESPCIASVVGPTGVLTPQPPAPPAVVDAACLAPAASDGEVASCLEESPIPLAQKPREPVAVDCSPCSTGSVATVKACSQSSTDSVTTPVEYPSSLEQSPVSRKRPGITPPSTGAPLKCAKKEQGTKRAPIDPDDTPLDKVDQRPNKAKQNRDLPTVRSLKLRILADRYIAGACFFYAVAQSLHALSSDVPLDDTSLRKAIGVCGEMSGSSIQESALSVNRDLEKDTWGRRLQGGLPDHFASLAKHVDGSVVLLRTNRFSMVTPRFAMDSELPSPTFWVPGRDVPLCVRGCGDMEEHCQRQWWWLLLRRNEKVSKVVAIFGEQSLIIRCL